MAPSGPRNGATASSRKAPGGGKTQRGGIAKRRAGGSAKVDRDGDLDMDATTRQKRSSHPAANGPARPKKPAPAPGRPQKSTAKAKQIIDKAISSGNLPNGISSSARVSRSNRLVNAPNSTTLKVEGLKTSKAANNEGGGVKELLTFLERKAQAVGKITRTIRIKKVCVVSDPWIWDVSTRRKLSAIVVYAT